MIRELLGKDREREEEAYIYSKEGNKTEIMDMQKKSRIVWQENMYQKAEKNDFSFRYGKGGQMEIMKREEKHPQSDIMILLKIEEAE